MKAKKIKQKDNLGSAVLAIIVFVGFIIGLLYFGISTQIKLAKSISVEELLDGRSVEDNGVNGTVNHESVEFLELEHRLNYIIPTGTDHYYLIFNEDGSRCIAYKGSGKWNREFDDVTGFTDSTVKIKGTVKKMPSEVKTYYNQAISKLNAEGFYFDAEPYYIDSSDGLKSIVQIITALAIIGVVIIGFCIIKFNINNTFLKRFGMFLLILLLVCVIYLFFKR
ncbi:MAG: hypothetical protein J6L69_00015 [Lachnospiraceae bacterium]|nr:hypothetical protein [Lachnospiraceae bacterium]